MLAEQLQIVKLKQKSIAFKPIRQQSELRLIEPEPEPQHSFL